MADTDTRPTKVLFREWRGGDSQAGETMAQRFADWYYAIATSRVGESRGAAPCQAACEKFGEGIVNVSESRALVGWAHEIIVAQMEPLGGRVEDGDEPCGYTNNQKPKQLLHLAREALPAEIALLEGSYSKSASPEAIQEMAAPLGGHPLGILKARYTVKQWLKANHGVPFDVAPDKPILDRAPLPLYEAGQMKSSEEEVNFEHWMISDLDLCKDIAEFAHFAIALRGGIGAPESFASAAPANTSAPSSSGSEVASTDDTDLEQNPGCMAKIMGMFGMG